MHWSQHLNLGKGSNTRISTTLCSTPLELLSTLRVTTLFECFSQWEIQTSVASRNTCLDCTFQGQQLALL